MSELLKKPKIFKKATKELDQVIGKNRWVIEKDIPNLPYVEAIVKETMRLHPVAPLLSPRLAQEDCKVVVNKCKTYHWYLIIIVFIYVSLLIIPSLSY